MAKVKTPKRAGIPSKVNSPQRIKKGEPAYGVKKFVVLAQEGGVKKTLRYGDANMTIKKSNPDRRKSFRARHKCDSKPSKLTSRYWSCKNW